MIGIDTNILMALALAEHEFHPRANELLRAEISRGEEFGITPAALAEFIHAATDPRRVERPMTMAQALEDARYWWNAAQVRQVFPTPDSVGLSLDWMARHRLGRKRVLDTALAATLHTAGVRRLFTANPDDFRIFGVFELLVP